jgi:2-polyprenyl-3-methyl-5-hydroxy-6-metoxy-1,4-benzoquinol methylase
MTAAIHKCPICELADTQAFFDLKNSPILQNILLDNEDEAKKIERFDVHFRYCSRCHFAFNPQFYESKIDYTENYNNNQLASKKYRQYIDRLTDKIIRHCKLYAESRILEIGCGNGYFLLQLHQKLNNRNIAGYDPAYNGQYGMSDFITKSYFKAQTHHVYDVIILRHVLEGLLNFDDVLVAIGAAMHRHTQLFIETPNLDYIIQNQDITLMYHEVARYFSVRAIQILLEKYDLEIQQMFLLFNENYLGVIASRRSDLSVFRDIHVKFEKLQDIISEYRKIIIWGISGRAISFLTHNGLDERKVQFGVDIDKDKQGKYIPVTGQLILSPQQAIDFEPDLVIVANANYLEEIKSEFKFRGQFLTLDGIIHEG